MNAQIVPFIVSSGNDIKYLAHILKHNSELKKLSLDIVAEYVYFKDMCKLMLSMENNSTVEKLLINKEFLYLDDKSYYGIGNCHDYSYYYYIVHILNMNYSIKKLILISFALSQDNAKKIVDVLRINSTLKVLELKYCGITDSCIEELAKILKINGTVEKLGL